MIAFETLAWTASFGIMVWAVPPFVAMVALAHEMWSNRRGGGR